MKKINQVLNVSFRKAWGDLTNEFAFSPIIHDISNFDFMGIELFRYDQRRRVENKIVVSTKRDMSRVLPILSKYTSLSFMVYLIDDDPKITIEDCYNSGFYSIDIGKDAISVLSTRYHFCSFYNIKKESFLDIFVNPMISSIYKNSFSSVHSAIESASGLSDSNGKISCDYPCDSPYDSVSSNYERDSFVFFCPFETEFLQKIEEFNDLRPFSNFGFPIFTQYGMKTYYKKISTEVNLDKMPLSLLDNLFLDYCILWAENSFYGAGGNYKSDFPVSYYFEEGKIFSFTSLYFSMCLFVESSIGRSLKEFDQRWTKNQYKFFEFLLRKTTEHVNANEQNN